MKRRMPEAESKRLREVIEKYVRVKDQWEKDREAWRAKNLEARNATRFAVERARELERKVDTQRAVLNKLQRKYDVVKGDLDSKQDALHRTVDWRVRARLRKLRGIVWRLRNRLRPTP